MNKKTYIAPSYEVDIFKEESILTSTSRNPGGIFGDEGDPYGDGPGEF